MHGFDDVQTTTNALAAFGLKPEAPPKREHLDLWPENILAFRVFVRMRTQWAVGMSGAVGLRYEALPLAMELEEVPADQRAEVVDGVQVMEQETLRLAREKR